MLSMKLQGAGKPVDLLCDNGFYLNLNEQVE